jgi:hypothetical protein
MLRGMDVELLKCDNQRSTNAGDIAQSSEIGRSVLEAEVLSYV